MKQKPKKYGIAFGDYDPRPADCVATLAEARQFVSDIKKDFKETAEAYAKVGAEVTWKDWYGGKPRIVKL